MKFIHLLKTHFLITIIVATSIAIAAIFIYSNTNHQYIVGTVDSKWIKQTKDSDKYLIYVEHDGIYDTYEITDNIFYLRFNSSDVYGSLKEGQTYRFDTIGFRVPFVSAYKNIISVDSNID